MPEITYRALPTRSSTCPKAVAVLRHCCSFSYSTRCPLPASKTHVSRCRPCSASRINDDDAAVFSRIRVLWIGRLGESLADRLQPIGRHAALANQIALDCVRSALRQLLVVGTRSFPVHVTFDQEGLLIGKLMV